MTKLRNPGSIIEVNELHKKPMLDAGYVFYDPATRELLDENENVVSSSDVAKVRKEEMKKNEEAKQTELELKRKNKIKNGLLKEEKVEEEEVVEEVEDIKEETPAEEETQEEGEKDLEALLEKYEEKFGKRPVGKWAKDEEWLLSKLAD